MSAADKVSRRAVLAGGSVLVVGFSLLPAMRLRSAEADALPGSLDRAPMLDAWIRIDEHGKVTVFSGKAELGQGMKTALRQIAAEELFVTPQSIELTVKPRTQTSNTWRRPKRPVSQAVSGVPTAVAMM